VCIVNSLQDGMNLVAKEFIAAQVDVPAGVLVLSKFAGAAEELDGAFEVNPYDPEEFAAAAARALLMRMNGAPSAAAAARVAAHHLRLDGGDLRGVGHRRRRSARPLSAADRWSRVR
jgi:hypothetical protein